MNPQKRKGWLMILLKSLVLVITCLSFLGILSCHTGTNSTSSSGGGSGTGTGWTITIQVGTNPLKLGDTTTVMAIVKDSTGAPAPLKTNVCIAALKNGFLQPGAATLYASICEETANNLGQMIKTYSASLETGDDRIEVSSQGVIATKIITVTN
jgi:hypothetical protein